MEAGEERSAVRRLGYLELTRYIAVADRDTTLPLTLMRGTQTLDTMRVRANLTAIYGVVGSAAPVSRSVPVRGLPMDSGPARGRHTRNESRLRHPQPVDSNG